MFINRFFTFLALNKLLLFTIETGNDVCKACMMWRLTLFMELHFASMFNFVN